MEDIDISAFLEEYEALCRKYHVHVDSCGCCNSPYLSDYAGESDIDGAIEQLWDPFTTVEVKDGT